MKKQKLPAENFSFEVSAKALGVLSEKFVRPVLSRTWMRYFGLAGWKSIIARVLVEFQNVEEAGVTFIIGEA
ncbi:hypothetical protein EZ456_24685 [Pedobacter psychrodurus]|uniref:Uncharacterized protein n=1 Tax=Pedobacter psychrodurus TaxID=2530456 RepID=A0A4R0PBK4_9SPHI|nr:hypothetical protein [Pedobacter psychrodurus]TCD14683.1 hypothetical protein EZ456_24685 [Pedobacter psychrodurus]